MKGPTIWRLPCGSARRTEKPSPRSRTRGTMTSSSASQARLSPSTGSVEGIQLMEILPSSSSARVCRAGVRREQLTPMPVGGHRPAEKKVMVALIFGCWRSPFLDERAVVQFGEGLPQLGLGVHYDRAVPRYRLLDRLARDQEEPDALLAGLDRHLVAAIEHHQRTISRSLADQRFARARCAFRQHAER